MKKTHNKKTTAKRSYKKRTYAKRFKPTITKGVASVPKSYQLLNTIKPPIYRFKDTIQFNDIVGAGASVSAVDKWDMLQIPRYSALNAMFRQYRITNIKYRFRLNNHETTDNAVIPVLYVRYNYDPEFSAGTNTENTMLRQSNMVCKTFSSDGGTNDTILEYNVKPAIMTANKLYNSTNYVPSPAFNRWCDFDPAGTLAEVEYWGIAYFIPYLPAGININIDIEFSYQCRDLI